MSVNSSGPLYCYNHPKRQTYLRCNRCERPICSSCAVLTPTGYRCKECVRGQQKVFDTARWWDYPVTAIVAFVLALIGSYFVSFVGFFIILVAPMIGIGIAESVRFVVRKRRSRLLPVVATVATVLGAILIELIKNVYILAVSSQLGLAGLLGLLWPVVYAALAASTVFYRLKGIHI